MRRILYILLFLIALGCEKIFEPEVEEGTPFLVIEGQITTDSGPHYLFVNNSIPYTVRPYVTGEPGGIAYLTDHTGERFDYEDLGNGLYRLVFDQEDIPRIGDIFTLHLISRDGDEYVSTPQEIVQAPPISGLYCTYEHQSVLTEDAYGAPREIDMSGMQVYMETDGILPINNYYMYSYSGYEQHHSTVMIGLFPYDIYRHRKMIFRFGSKVQTVNADDFGGFRVRNEGIVFLAKDDLNNYIPIIPDTMELLGSWFEGCVFKLNQYSISPDAYQFYNAIENQLNAEGHLFDPAIPQIRGNLTCRNDSTKAVVGVFTASDVASRYAYFYVDYRGQTFSKQIDSFPELWLDTCSWAQPQTWIIPPF